MKYKLFNVHEINSRVTSPETTGAVQKENDIFMKLFVEFVMPSQSLSIFCFCFFYNICRPGYLSSATVLHHIAVYHFQRLAVWILRLAIR